MSALQKIRNRQNPVIPRCLRLFKKGGLHEFKLFQKNVTAKTLGRVRVQRDLGYKLHDYPAPKNFSENHLHESYKSLYSIYFLSLKKM
ncbi:hypothetical protein BUZ16_04050 [Staphylococcus haemolyticus]|nr:hypothetical protein BUZ16_04050 [Staphylococcus haemolyticus]PTL14115.1 hypothetical protein BUZ30_10540 [Staphylococcus haemolyticus]